VYLLNETKRLYIIIVLTVGVYCAIPVRDNDHGLVSVHEDRREINTALEAIQRTVIASIRFITRMWTVGEAIKRKHVISYLFFYLQTDFWYKIDF
jgi:hypothetical protein